MLKICGNNIFWNRKFQKGTLIKEHYEVNFIPNIMEGDFYPGWICPGLVNAHCHLELSHLKKTAFEVKGKGMAFFICWIQKNRNEFLDIQIAAIQETLNEFQKEGIFFVGDICNTLITKEIKKKYQKIYFRNFWEVFGLNPEIKEEKWTNIQQNAKELDAFITLHSPYSCSRNLIEKVHSTYPVLQSIHIAESQEEIDYFHGTSLKFYEAFFEIGIPSKFLKDKLPYPEAILSNQTQQYLLVHNVFLNTNKIPQNILDSCYFCICPTSNLFLHKKTVSDEFIYAFKHKICLGTDSYASNYQLSILDEMNYLKKLKLTSNEIVLMATLNGYKALLISDFILNEYHQIVHIYEVNEKFRTQILWS